ncbi:hypothetical protein BDW69DRAFT_106080 [Aspergillus filifer]
MKVSVIRGKITVRSSRQRQSNIPTSTAPPTPAFTVTRIFILLLQSPNSSCFSVILVGYIFLLHISLFVVSLTLTVLLTRASARRFQPLPVLHTTILPCLIILAQIEAEKGNQRLDSRDPELQLAATRRRCPRALALPAELFRLYQSLSPNLR